MTPTSGAIAVSAVPTADAQLKCASLTRILWLFLVWRIALMLAFSVSAYFLPALRDGYAFDTNNEPAIIAATNVPLWQRATYHWDGYYYLHIAAHGYRDTEPRDFAFFPLFPVIVSVLHALGLGLVPAGLLITTIASAVACIFLYRIALDYTADVEAAERAVMLFLLFPSSYFLAAYYPEALYCAMGFAALWLARQRRWFSANLLIALMTATRPTGLCFAIAVGMEYLSAKRFSWQALDRRAYALLLGPIGLLAHLAYLQFWWGDAFRFAHVLPQFWPQTHFTSNLLKPLYATARIAAGLTYNGMWVEAIYRWTTLVCCLTAIFVLVHSARKLPISYTALVASSLVLFLSTGHLGSVPRYILTLFPMYPVMAAELSVWRYRLWLIISTAVMAFLLTAFANFRMAM
ncbi:MAG: mannosyltransferase family protein [Terriglobales bacterium]